MSLDEMKEMTLPSMKGVQVATLMRNPLYPDIAILRATLPVDLGGVANAANDLHNDLRERGFNGLVVDLSRAPRTDTTYQWVFLLDAGCQEGRLPMVCVGVNPTGILEGYKTAPTLEEALKSIGQYLPNTR